jgi:transcription antitermination factor NusG
MDGSKKWYLVYTRAGWEKKVAENLTRRKIENYCPLNNPCKNNNRKTIINEPLFNSYVFVRISETELLILKNTVGVINLVYWLDKPAVIRDAEIEIIKKVLNEYISIQLEKTSRESHAKQQVQVFSINNNLKIILPSLGYFLIAEMKSINQKVSGLTIAAQADLLYPVYAVK